MATFEVNTLQDLIDACIATDSAESDSIIDININKDIDLNDNSKYWIIEDHLLSITMRKLTVNIHGNNHSIKNVYIVNGSLFKIYFTNNSGYKNNIYIYDLDFDFVLNRNPIDTSILALFYSEYYNTYLNCILSFTNCTFRAKLFVASSISNQSTNNKNNALFNTSHCNTYFKNCIFNIEYYRLHKMNQPTDCLTLSYIGASNFSTLTNCQFYIKTYLVDSITSGEYSSREFFAHCNINNCFFIIEVCANNSTVLFLFSDNYTTFYNSYIVLKMSSNASISPNMKLLISSSSNSSVNNFICDADTSSATQIDAPADYFKIVTPSNAKNANFLLSNVGFIIKA